MREARAKLTASDAVERRHRNHPRRLSRGVADRARSNRRRLPGGGHEDLTTRRPEAPHPGALRGRALSAALHAGGGARSEPRPSSRRPDPELRRGGRSALSGDGLRGGLRPPRAAPPRRPARAGPHDEPDRAGRRAPSTLRTRPTSFIATSSRPTSSSRPLPTASMPSSATSASPGTSHRSAA